MSIKTNKRQRELFFMLPTREYNMISSAYYDRVDKAKKGDSENDWRRHSRKSL